MIISASRRSDIPAFYGTWFMNRIRAGWCAVPNPFNAKQVSRVSLARQDVHAIVFWTRLAKPFMRHLPELDSLGYPYLFQHTLVDYPRSIEPCAPPLGTRIRAFQDLAQRLGPERVVWRYDPMLVSGDFSLSWHLERFAWLARTLAGCSVRCVTSFMEFYAKTRRRLAGTGSAPPVAAPRDPCPADKAALVRDMAAVARQQGMELSACCQGWRDEHPVVPASACIDGELLGRLFRIPVSGRRDPGQRQGCCCAPSRDIGMYDSCCFACRYCYATRSEKAARASRSTHDPLSPSLVGQHLPATEQDVQHHLPFARPR